MSAQGKSAAEALGEALAKAIWDAMPDSVAKVLLAMAVENPQALGPLCDQLADALWRSVVVDYGNRGVRR